MNRASVIAELARVLQVNETEAERLLRAFAQVLGPIAAEVPPYFERYFEAQIQRVLQSLADFKEDTNRRFEEVNRNFAAFREDTNRRFEGGGRLRKCKPLRHPVSPQPLQRLQRKRA